MLWNKTKGKKKETSVGCNNYDTKTTALSLPFFWTWTLLSCHLPREKFNYPECENLAEYFPQSVLSVAGVRTVSPATITCSHIKSSCPLPELVTIANSKYLQISFFEALWKTGPQTEKSLIFLDRRLLKNSGCRRIILCNQKELSKLTSPGELLRGQR